MKFTCPKCGTQSDISIEDCHKACGEHAFKRTLEKFTPETRKLWYSQGGKVRATKYTLEQKQEMGKKGGRPRKK